MPRKAKMRFCLSFSPDLRLPLQLRLDRTKWLIKATSQMGLLMSPGVCGVLTHACYKHTSSCVRGGVGLVLGFILNFASLS